MPRIIDKIIINGEEAQGDFDRIHRQHGVMRTLADEVKDLGLLKETDPMRDEMQGLCDAFAQACTDYLAGCKKITRDLQKLIDQHS